MGNEIYGNPWFSEPNISFLYKKIHQYRHGELGLLEKAYWCAAKQKNIQTFNPFEW